MFDVLLLGSDIWLAGAGVATDRKVMLVAGVRAPPPRTMDADVMNEGDGDMVLYGCKSKYWSPAEVLVLGV
jgi:hypothetical protein